MTQKTIVLVTGGTNGIGKEIVKSYLNLGAIVIATYSRNAKNALEFYNEMNSDNLLIRQCPAEDTSELTDLFNWIDTQLGHLNILVNNAGINQDATFLDMRHDQWKTVLNVNLGGSMTTAILGLALMSKTTQKGYLINVSSVSGLYGRAGQANYATSKGGIIGLTKLLARTYNPNQFQINCIIPGIIDTDMAQAMPPDKINALANATSKKRLGLAQEIAKGVVFLSSENASYMSGTCLCIDGGFFK